MQQSDIDINKKIIRMKIFRNDKTSKQVTPNMLGAKYLTAIYIVRHCFFNVDMQLNNY